METSTLRLLVGVKSDPVEYRYSYEWLFRLMAEEDVHHLQLGTFFEMYHLPDESLLELRDQAERAGVRISSLFSSHRELGGMLRPEPGWEGVARRCYERLIEVGALLGADSVGANAGAIMRDRMDFKPEAIRRYLGHMRELMVYAREQGLAWLTIEPMSCLAEPPTLPEEITAMADELAAYHRQHPDRTARIGYCVDVAHGYADRAGTVRWDNMQLLQASLPYLAEIHLKNTDGRFDATFGFSEAERARGIVDIEAVKALLLANTQVIPVREVVGYLEIGGPKTGRDYTDYQLEDMLRRSLRYLRQVFPTGTEPASDAAGGRE